MKQHFAGPVAATQAPAGPDCEAVERAQVAAVNERVRALRAQAALAGWQLHMLADGVVGLVRWCRMREFTDIGEAEQFIRALG